MAPPGILPVRVSQMFRILGSTLSFSPFPQQLSHTYLETSPYVGPSPLPATFATFPNPSLHVLLHSHRLHTLFL